MHNYDSHSITVAVSVLLSSDLCFSSSWIAVVSCPLKLVVPDEPKAVAKKPLTLALPPLVVIVFTATLMPAFWDVLWNAAAFEILVVFQTLASKFATAPVLNPTANICFRARQVALYFRTKGHCHNSCGHSFHVASAHRPTRNDARSKRWARIVHIYIFAQNIRAPHFVFNTTGGHFSQKTMGRSVTKTIGSHLHVGRGGKDGSVGLQQHVGCCGEEIHAVQRRSAGSFCHQLFIRRVVSGSFYG